MNTPYEEMIKKWESNQLDKRRKDQTPHSNTSSAISFAPVVIAHELHLLVEAINEQTKVLNEALNKIRGGGVGF